MFASKYVVSCAAVGLSAAGFCHVAHALPRDEPKSRLEVVHTFTGPMPTGVTVSQQGRIFVNYPRWGDPVKFTVGEIKNGREVPFPNKAWNNFANPNRSARFVSVQSVVVDPKDRLWALDTGSVKLGRVQPQGPKMVCLDLNTNRVVRTISFPPSVVLPYSYINDVRFDLRRGKAGYAFITDSANNGPNAIIVVNLATGQSVRRLNAHPSVSPVPKFVPFVEGRPVMVRMPDKFPKYVALGSDGIAISSDGGRLFYCPLASRRLYSVSVDALVDGSMSDAQVAQTIIDHGDKGASDGLESDNKGRIYATEYEGNAIARRMPNGVMETVVHDSRILWPDTMSVAGNGYLYFTANQLHRQPNYQYGKDLRRKPYTLFRVKIDAGPVRLK